MEPKTKKKILIDLQGCQTASRVRGIGSYVSSLVESLVKNYEDVYEFHALLNSALYFSKRDGLDCLSLFDKNAVHVWGGMKGISFDGGCDQNKKQISEVLREKSILDLQPDVLLITSLFEGAVDDAIVSINKIKKSNIPVLTIFYDLIPLLFPDAYLSNKDVKSWYYRQLEYLKESDRVLAISSCTEKDVVEHLGISKEKVINISSDVHPRFKLDHISNSVDSDVLKKFGINKSYFLYVGVISETDPRKNFSTLIKAYLLLPESYREKHQLVLAGHLDQDVKEKYRKIVKKLGVNDSQINFTGQVSFQDLIILFRSCELFIFPSLYEGFGLPVLEAMWSDVPVIGSNVASVKEIIVKSEAMFDPNNAEELSNLIRKYIESPNFRDELIKNSFVQRERFSWNKTVGRVINEVENLLSRNELKAPALSYGELLDELKDIDIKGGLAENDLNWISLAISENMVNRTEKRMYVDVSILADYDSGSGIQRVVKKILNCLLTNDSHGYEVRSVINHCGYYTYEDRFIDKESPLNGQAIDIESGDVFLGLDLYVEKNDVLDDYLEYHRFRGLKVYRVVYDLIPVNFPQWFESHFSGLFEDWFRKITQFSDGVICISQTVAREFIDWYQTQTFDSKNKLNIGYFHLGADFKLDSESASPEKRISDKYSSEKTIRFLMVGTIEPRKGVDQILSAFEILWSEGKNIELNIVGKEGWLMENFIHRLNRHPMKDKRLFWSKKISDEQLVELYRDVDAVIAASYTEGYGLPIIEAAKYQTPVLVRDIPVFREVGGEGVFYFSGGIPELVAKDFSVWLDLFASDKEPKSRNVCCYSWEDSCEQLLDVMFRGNWLRSINVDRHEMEPQT